MEVVVAVRTYWVEPSSWTAVLVAAVAACPNGSRAATMAMTRRAGVSRLRAGDPGRICVPSFLASFI